MTESEAAVKKDVGAVVSGSVEFGPGCVLQALSRVDGDRTALGEEVVVEDKAFVRNSEVGNRSVIGVGAFVDDSVIGEGSRVGAKARVLNKSRIGSGCIIGPLVELDGVTVDDNMSVVLIDGKWQALPCNPSFMQKNAAGLRGALLSAS